MLYFKQIKIRVGLIAFAKTVLFKINLTTDAQKWLLIFIIDFLRHYRIKYTKPADTNLHDALKTVKEMFALSESQYGHCLPQYAFVISYSKSIDHKKTMKYAKLLGLGNTVFSIGIGKNIRRREMTLIASRPSYSFFLWTNFNRLDYIIPVLYMQICGGMY